MELPFAGRGAEDRPNDGMLRGEILRAQPGGVHVYRWGVRVIRWCRGVHVIDIQWNLGLPSPH